MFIQIYIIGPIKKQNLTQIKGLFRSLNITTYFILKDILGILHTFTYHMHSAH